MGEHQEVSRQGAFVYYVFNGIWWSLKTPWLVSHAAVTVRYPISGNLSAGLPLLTALTGNDGTHLLVVFICLVNICAQFMLY